MIPVLKELGADLNKTDIHGNTPAHKAARKGYADVIIALKEAGADLNIKDGDGNTAFDTAKKRGHTNLIPLLGQFAIKS